MAEPTDKQGHGQPGAGQQLIKFACLDCHSVFKRPVADIGKRNVPRPIEVRRCPACGCDAYLMSSDFRAPPKSDAKAWEVVAALTRAGLPYFRIYEDMPLSAFGHPARRPKAILSAQYRVGPWPETMAEAKEFIARHRDKAMPFVRAD
ncbi:hypothetical protein OKA06_06825 [Novosphingobium sp. MW5]|nr:hypothetical protein [Novosphingobium sp. MW5]